MTKKAKIIWGVGAATSTVLVGTGVGVFMWAYKGYHPVTPKSDVQLAKEAHLFFEGNKLYSYSDSTEYDIKLSFDNNPDHKVSNIYGDNKDNKVGTKSFKVTKEKAFAYSIPLDVKRIKVEIAETKSADKKKKLNKIVKYYKRKADNATIWIKSNSFNVGSSTKRVDITPLDISKKTKEGEFVKAIFSSKTLKQVLNDGVHSLNGWKLGKITKEVKPDDYKKYDEYVKAHNNPTNIHHLFWHATAETHLKGLEGSVKDIEPNVLSEVIKAELINSAGKTLTVYLIKSKDGNSPSLGVKYGSLLSKNGFSVAGKPIDGKDWIQELKMVSTPANDILGIYTVIVNGDDQNSIDLSNDLAQGIGGIN